MEQSSDNIFQAIAELAWYSFPLNNNVLSNTRNSYLSFHRSIFAVYGAISAKISQVSHEG
ncbi:unnamed protein product [Acanthoscelides obtectus]|uniref:Uncharacterized protein n=1 Tax=Acanthoscelides obtectus TaxID=200917 RepID=A0A9P0PLI2_ACAOB|nr:unnamed protein product [Acanthoscelides obtectus]CAK1674477.1 hypothetical protein AOBTE_LOCUS29633 [Acanthoscelides obtectus]